MKFRRFLSGLLFGFGCALTFIGILAAVLPSLANQQLKLVLASFAAPSDNAAVAAINRFMTFALSNGWRLALLGVMTAAAGGLLLYCFQPRRSSKAAPPAAARPCRPQPVPAGRRTVHVPAAAVDREAPNPFAVASYQAHPQQQRRTSPPIAFHAAPMLDRNRIENDPAPARPIEAMPYFSPAATTETYAAPNGTGAVRRSRSRNATGAVLPGDPKSAATCLDKMPDA